MQFENISIHCENGHIVEHCEIMPLLRHLPDEVLMVQHSIDMLCYDSIYLCFSRLKQSLSMVNFHHHHHLFAIRRMIYKTLDISSMTGQQGIQMHQQLPMNKCTCKAALENSTHINNKMK